MSPFQHRNPAHLALSFLILFFLDFLQFAFSNFLKRKCMVLLWGIEVEQKSLPPGRGGTMKRDL